MNCVCDWNELRWWLAVYILYETVSDLHPFLSLDPRRDHNLKASFDLLNVGSWEQNS